jgi:hypothetical protein
MPRVSFERTVPVFEQAKTVQALDRAATVIGVQFLWAFLNALFGIFIREETHTYM